jgi:hypothetical protein
MKSLRIREAENQAAYRIWIMDEQDSGVFVAKPVVLEFERCSEAGEQAWRLPDPTLTLGYASFLQLKESLRLDIVARGLELPGVANKAKLEATERHLEDMRRLVFEGFKDIAKIVEKY